MVSSVRGVFSGLMLGSALFSLEALAAAEPSVEAILGRLSLAEKIGQMIQAQNINVDEEMSAGKNPVRDLNLGSILAGGDSLIADNSPAGWRASLGRFQDAAQQSSAGLPLLLGVDAIHGHGLVRGATLFPHNIGLGAARNPEMMKKIGAATAREVLVTGFNWNFSPGVIVARDPRWGRTYESFGEDPELQRLLVAPFVRGLQETPVSGTYMVGTAKHFLGDGGTTWGTGVPAESSQTPQIDRGDTRGDLKQILQTHGQGYKEAIAAGIDTVMASYNSVNGVRMHANKELLTHYLKAPTAQGGLGFEGFVISDWNAIDELDVPENRDILKRYQQQLVASVDAGVDMIMVFDKLPGDTAYRYQRVHELLLDAVKAKQISVARIDDAVRRILKIKQRAGLFHAQQDRPFDEEFGKAEHREIARAAVRESLVLIKNEQNTLPIRSDIYSTLCVAGSKADDFGTQAGAWTNGWQGKVGNADKTEGALTILDGLKAAAAARGIQLIYSADGRFSQAECRSGKRALSLVVVGERPYAEFKGDRAELKLESDDLTVINRVRLNQGPLAVILLSGRPIAVTGLLSQWQAFVAAWLPGSQGEGVADVLFGESDFRGRLPMTWPSEANLQGRPLFPYDFGLTYKN